MTPREIKDRLKEKNLTQADLEARFGVSHTTVNFLVNRKMRSDRLERKLARALGVKLEDLRAPIGVPPVEQ